jgi:parallel beta-helix repeat protein
MKKSSFWRRNMYNKTIYKSTVKFIAASLIIMLALAAMPTALVNAAACTFTATATGNWNAAGTWAPGGVGTSCSTYPGQTFPGDIVIINTGVAVTVNIHLTTNPIGDVTINSGGTWDETNDRNINFGGNLQNDGTFTAVNGTHTFSGSAKTIGGANALAIPNVTINGTITNNGTLTVSSSLAGGGTLTNGATGNLTYRGFGAIVPTLTATAAGNTVNYSRTSGTGNQTVKATPYSNLTLSGNGSKTISSGTSIGATMSIIGTAKANIGAGLTIPVNFLLLDGTGQVSGTWGSTSSAATNTNNTYFALTTGMLNVATGAGAPTVTTDTAIGVTRTGATLRGTVNAQGSSTIVTFNYGTTPSFGTTVTATQSPITGFDNTPVSYALPGVLLPSTTYYYQVVAASNIGEPVLGSTLSFTTAPAGSKTYYVDNTNNTVTCADLNGTAGGTLVAPFCMIGYAAAYADAGDTVHVLAGTYPETVKPTGNGGDGMRLIFSAEAGVKVTGNGLPNIGNPTGAGGAFRLTSKGYIQVNGFTIDQTADYGIYAIGSNNIEIYNNHVSYSGSTTFDRAGIYLNETTNSTINLNTTDHNYGDGIRLNGSSSNTVSNNISYGNATLFGSFATGINLLNSAHNVIARNITYANEDTGLNFYSGSSYNLVILNLTYGNSDHGIDNNASPYNTLISNTVHGNVTVGINFEHDDAGNPSDHATLVNNISVENGYRHQVGSPDPLTVSHPGNIRVDEESTVGTTMDYDLVYKATPGTIQIVWNGLNYTDTQLEAFKAASGQEAHILQGDPLFLAPAAVAERPSSVSERIAINVGDYHLTAGSPAIDSANSSDLNEQATDIEGNPRWDDPLSSNPYPPGYDDRGAYEYGIVKVDTTTTITNDTPDPSAVGESVLISFSVLSTSGSGTPTGDVIVTVLGSTETCTGTVAAGSCSIAFTTAGEKTLTATYAGDLYFNGSASTPAANHTVKGDTTTTITSDLPDPSAVGESVLISFSVLSTSGSGTPTGEVIVTVLGSTETCTGTVAAGSCSIAFTAAGLQALTATYAGDLYFNGSASTPATNHTVKGDTTTTITSDLPDPSAVGESVLISFSVLSTSGSGTPSGDVIVTVLGSTDTCIGTVAARSCSIAFTSIGEKTLTATYGGDPNYSPSTSGTVSHAVTSLLRIFLALIIR